MSNQKYLIPAIVDKDGSKGINETSYEQVIKRSRFIARIRHIESVSQAKQWFAEVGDEFPDARHLCWAYISGEPNSSEQSSSDDGEPSGTAGKPILNVLQHSGAGEIAALVVRYFGGIKLGTGGLVRAYSGTVVEALKVTELKYKIPQQVLHFELPFADENTFRYLLEQSHGQIESIRYYEHVNVVCQLPLSEVELLIQKLPHSILRLSKEGLE